VGVASRCGTGGSHEPRTAERRAVGARAPLRPDRPAPRRAPAARPAACAGRTRSSGPRERAARGATCRPDSGRGARPSARSGVGRGAASGSGSWPSSPGGATAPLGLRRRRHRRPRPPASDRGQKAGRAERALGRPRGGPPAGTRLVAGGRGRPADVRPTGGRASDSVPALDPLLDGRFAPVVIAGRGYDSDRALPSIEGQAGRQVIPPRPRRPQRRPGRGPPPAAAPHRVLLRPARAAPAGRHPPGGARHAPPRRGPARPQPSSGSRMRRSVDRAQPHLIRLSYTSSIAGPTRTMNNVGNMKRIIGTVSVAGKRAAFSSARNMRVSLNSFDKTLSD
jgi:hypothetical protein